MEIIHYKKKFNVNTLIETGTFHGYTVDSLKFFFEKIYSIELNMRLFEKAKTYFREQSHIQVLQGDSSLVLADLLPTLDASSLFWLDAHYSGHGTSKGETETPIMRELSLIFNHKIKNHVILIDDAREFNNTHDYPALKDLENYVFSKRPDLKFSVKDDIIRIHV